jgi:catechol 2,3-dioxygenase-like lactoylglutathione lyase family enzyme
LLSHVTLGTNHIERAVAFYDLALAPLGLARVEADIGQGWAGWAASPAATLRFWVMRPLDGNPAIPGNGVTIAFEAPDRAAVDAFHATALIAGGTDEGGPGLRPHYHADFYAAYIRDPDGNKLCCVCHRPTG